MLENEGIYNPLSLSLYLSLNELELGGLNYLFVGLLTHRDHSIKTC